MGNNITNSLYIANQLKINNYDSNLTEEVITDFLIYIVLAISITLYVYFKVKKLTESQQEKSSSVQTEFYLTPIQAAMMLEDKVKNYHIIATILHFLELGFIELTKIYRKDGTFAYRFEKKEKEFCDYYSFSNRILSTNQKEKLKNNKISVSEIYIIDRIVFKYYNYVNADRIYEFYDSYDDYSKLYNNSREINELKDLDYDLKNVEKIIKEEFKEKGIHKAKRKNLYNIKTSELFFKKSVEITEYKNKLKYDTYLSERSIENVYLWGEHLIYGVAFNVCKTSIKDAISIYEGKRKK